MQIKQHKHGMGSYGAKQEAASPDLQEKTAKIGYVDLSSSSDPVRLAVMQTVWT